MRRNTRLVPILYKLETGYEPNYPKFSAHYLKNSSENWLPRSLLQGPLELNLLH